MISYSQVYADEQVSVDSLLKDMPTDEAVEWCSYIVFRKDNLIIGETDIHILSPLLFSFESELQHKLTDYLGGFYNGVDCLIDKFSLLNLTQYLIAHHNEEHHELTKDEKTRLFKAYLLFCDEYLERISFGQSMPDKYTAEDMLNYYMPITLLTSDIDTFTDSSLEVIKGKWFFVDFSNSDKKFKQFVDDFIRIKGYHSAIEYLGYIFNIVASTVVHEPPTNIIKFSEDSGKWIDFMDGMSADSDNFEENDGLSAIQSRPIYRLGENKYAILFTRFFVDKMFQGMLFDMAAALASEGIFKDKVGAYISLKQQVGERFSEQFLLYRTLEKTLFRRMPVRLTGEALHKVLKSGEPDYYARRNNRVFVFEFKDVRLDAQTKSSCNYVTIRQKLYNCFVENEDGRPKGVKQLANVIENKLPDILEKSDMTVPKVELKIYPIIVYTDGSFDIEGINYYLSGEFRRIIHVTDDRYQVKDLVMVNLNLLMKLENFFVDGKIELDKVINEFLAYKESKEQLKTVPFNKYLFQYARKKGFDMKLTRTFRQTFVELVEMEKEMMN